MLDQDTARALLTLADETGVRVALIGDRHQLPAVGRGGVLDLAARFATTLPLERVHRFADPRYAALSLDMRQANDPGSVFDRLFSRGAVVLHASEVERSMALAVRASQGDCVVADSRHDVGAINDLTHQVRVACDEARDGIVTAAGQRIGVGDRIATRRNSAEEHVANREEWTVVAVDRGRLDVVGESGRRDLSVEYAHKHVELAYAITAYGAQGTTVPVAHVVVGETSTASSTYVGMTRGRERNVAHLVADSVPDARQQWIDVFNRDRADLGPAHAAMRAADDVERYGPKAPVRRQHREPERISHEEPPYRPAPSRSPGIGF